MPNKAQIKIIKKNSVKTHKTSKATPEIKEDNKKQGVMREVVSTVSDWVNEFQKRRKETKQTFDLLFVKSDKQSSV